jgi:hypothetical protein
LKLVFLHIEKFCLEDAPLAARGDQHRNICVPEIKL